MNQNDALRKARLILGLDAEVGRVPGKGPEARFCIASKAHNLSLRGPSFEALIGALETYGIRSPASEELAGTEGKPIPLHVPGITDVPPPPPGAPLVVKAIDREKRVIILGGEEDAP